MSETINIQTILAWPVWVYISHLLTWASIAAVALVFRRRLKQAVDFFLDSHQDSVSTHQRDRFMGIASGITTSSLILLVDINLIFALLIGAVVFYVTPIILQRRRFKSYQKAFDESLVESLATVSSSLRAGLTLKDSLVVSVQNCPAAFSNEVTRVLKDYRFGASIEHALDGVRKRIQTQNANIAFGALIIGTQLGGRIPDILNRIVTTIREVDRVEGRLKALTAQGRAQGTILCAMPIIVSVGIYLMDQEKMLFMMSSPVGKVLIGLAVFLEIVGILVTLKVMKLDV